MIILLIISVGLVAFANGANDNFKGVASLYGSGTTSFWPALWWGTVCTFLGSLTALFLAEGMVKKFSGKGLVEDSVAQTPAFMTSVALGAAVTSFLATRLSFPVSTTHSLVGALLGAGLVTDWSEVHWTALGSSFVFPLVCSPLIAVVLGAATYGALNGMRLLPKGPNRLLDTAHFVSAGAASFSRGLNDTPKMAALLMVVPNMNLQWVMLSVAAMIAVGAMMDARNVAETMAKKVTDMTPSQGFTANLVTSLLVTTASFHSYPVSTTHVSVGGLLGMGMSTRQTKWRNVIDILLAWLVTVPCGATASAAVAFLLNVWKV